MYLEHCQKWLQNGCVLQKWLTAKTGYLFSQNASSYLFDKVLNTLLEWKKKNALKGTFIWTFQFYKFALQIINLHTENFMGSWKRYKMNCRGRFFYFQKVLWKIFLGTTKKCENENKNLLQSNSIKTFLHHCFC